MNLTTNFLVDVKGVSFFWDEDFLAFDSLRCESVVEVSYVVCGEDIVRCADYLVGWWIGDFLG